MEPTGQQQQLQNPPTQSLVQLFGDDTPLNDNDNDNDGEELDKPVVDSSLVAMVPNSNVHKPNSNDAGRGGENPNDDVAAELGSDKAAEFGGNVKDDVAGELGLDKASELGGNVKGDVAGVEKNDGGELGDLAGELGSDKASELGGNLENDVAGGKNGGVGELGDVSGVKNDSGELGDVAGVKNGGGELGQAKEAEFGGYDDVAGVKNDGGELGDVSGAKNDGGELGSGKEAEFDDVAGVKKDGGSKLGDVAGVKKDGGKLGSAEVADSGENLKDDVAGVKNHKSNVETVKGDEEDAAEEEEEEPMEEDEEEEEELMESDEEEQPVKTRGRVGRKRKRGGKSAQAQGTPKSSGGGGKKVEDEDVCFMCYDGGDLVLCDKRDCPKAYHPSCINRDEAFFQTKGRWNCCWHLCSICSKKAEYMCHACTFSLCKLCIKTNVIICVKEKEKKGFCQSCMKTVMLIEKGPQEDQENIDFNNKNSWEYFFKDYWADLKVKLNLSLSDLVEAENALKESGTAGKKGHSEGDSGSEDPSENLESQTKKTRRKNSKKPKTRADSDSESEDPSVNLETQTKKTRRRKSKKPKARDGTEWASKELIEFVTHMGKDTSYQSQFDVQALLLEYIKTNKLRDSRRKSQIICDARLQGLFGKPRVGHFEMLKLLESHFLIKEDDYIQGSVVDTETSPVDEKTKDKKRKHRKKGDQEPQSNREDYAAIDTHNINLIYLKRKLAEDILDDIESFRDKVVGTFVRIRIPGANPNNDIYRLVQVTGTITGAHYGVGRKTTDILLEILNLDKTESVSIDTISNQDFTEDECKRLRQSIKCGLINRLTVGDILDKAVELQAARVNDWIEAEVLRLSHLRDRASDLGRKKELRVSVEKLEILKTPDERARRLQEIPVVHDDPTMDPKHESEDDSNKDDQKQDAHHSSLDSRFSKRQDYSSKGSWRGTGISTSGNPGKSYEFSRNLSSNNFSKKAEDTALSPRMGAAISPRMGAAISPRMEPHIDPPPIVLKKPSSANEIEKVVGPIKEDASETDKIWHYKDPSGKVQGPFSMAQLRKWNKNKFFPVDLRIWRTSEKEEDGIILTDALEGRFPVKSESHGFANLPSPTPIQSLLHVGPPVGHIAYHVGLQSPTPNGSQMAASLVTGVKQDPNTIIQPLAVQNAYGWSGAPTQNQQPHQWAVQNPAGNFLQQSPQPNVSWPTGPPNPNMGLVGPAAGNQTMNWGTVNVNPSWGLQAGPGNANPGWVPPQPVVAVTPSQGWVAGPGPGPGPTQLPIVSGNGNHSEVVNLNQGWDSPRPRNGDRGGGREPYNRSRDRGAGSEPYNRSRDRGAGREPYNRSRDRGAGSEPYNRSRDRGSGSGFSNNSNRRRW